MKRSKRPKLKITLSRHEGPKDSGIGIPVSFNTFTAAQGCLEMWAKTAPVPGDGYDKYQVYVTFPDGNTWVYRYDLVCDGSEGDGRSFKENLHRRLQFWAGTKTPPHMTPERHMRLLSSRAEIVREAKAILQKWEKEYFETNERD
jgi:hypothetical protein